ncbi:MAG: septal ring lytic transglycosylase RlpA family protein [Acetobacteraceae bacterium]
MARRFVTDLSGLVMVCATLQACANTTPRIAVWQPVAPASLAEPRAGSGRTVVGEASYYAPKLAGRTMAGGRTYSTDSNAAASETLPLGSTAKVTNLDTGKSAVVRVQDRGPHAKGRIIDVSSKVADKLDMKHAGVAHIAVKPLVAPHRDGAASGEAPSEE